MGPSGSGKSTLLNVLGCLDLLDSGRYELDGRRIDGYGRNALATIRNRHFGFVFQLFNLIPRLTASRNVELPMFYANVPRAERQRRAAAVLADLGLADRVNHSPAQLSGGQQQRVAIARALVNDPDVIIGDEPTGSLDSRSGEEVMEIFSRMHALGKTIIIVTHEPAVAAYARRVVHLRDGVIDREVRA
jgi:putative ABC transport system ATP-binding protein